MISYYIKIAARHLWKNRLYTGINIIGLTVALTTVVLAILYYQDEHHFDTFHKNPGLYRITTTYIDNKTGQTETHGETGMVQGPAFKMHVPEIADFARLYGGDVMINIKSADNAFIVGVGFTDSSFFKIFSFPLLQGNPNTVLQQRNSIVISESTARKFFGTTNAMGKRLDMEDTRDSLFASFIVTGIAKNPPANSSIKFDVLIPFSYLNTMWTDDYWLNPYLGTFAVLKRGANLKSVEQSLALVHNTYAKQQMEQAAKTGVFDKRTLYNLQPVTDIHLHPYSSYYGSSPFYSNLLLGISLFILLMASINFINLSIAGSLKRAKEIGIRKISGSSKQKIITQFLIESAIVCGSAFCMAIALSQSLLPFFNQVADKQIVFSVLSDWRLFAWFGGLLLLNILLSGLYPAFIIARFQPKKVLYNQPALSAGKNRFGKSLVVFQFSMAVVFIITAVVYYQQMDYIRTKDLGYNPFNIIRIDVPPKRPMKQVYTVFKNDLANQPGIQQVSVEAIKSDIKTLVNGKQLKVTYKLVDTSYIPMLQIQLKAGRNFSAMFGTDPINAVIVNEAFVKQAGLSYDAINTPVIIDDWVGKKPVTIIGVMKDYNLGSLKELIKPVMLSLHDGLEGGTLLVKINRHKANTTLTSIEKAYKTAAPEAGFTYAFWDELNAREYKQEYKWQQIIYTATGLSIIICCLGLFGLAHLATRLRTKEIGIRKVLGASVGAIASQMSAGFIRLVLISIVIAAPVAWYLMNQWLQNFAYRISINVWVFVTAAVTAILIALLTTGLQAIKAAKANPVKALRNQ